MKAGSQICIILFQTQQSLATMLVGQKLLQHDTKDSNERNLISRFNQVNLQIIFLMIADKAMMDPADQS